MELPTSTEINVGVPSNPSTGITLVLNLNGNGPFTVNVNVNTAPALEDPPITPLHTPRRGVLRTPRRGVSTVHPSRGALTHLSARMTPYSRPSPGRSGVPSDTPQFPVPSPTPQDDEVPETPQSQYELLCDVLPGAASDEPCLPLPQFAAASPATSDSSVTEPDSSIAGETPRQLSPSNPFFSVTDSQVDAHFGPGYFERCSKNLLRGCIEFNKQEEEEESQAQG
ncbi:hypothetical protein GGX14DRAFT_580796 [Mycena pura]|uniref:Uncharacterized protein n=1 Tax=Mycena pura TaxID=153505 RepID=A0AAD6UPM2_9AGAR|nr:hypothetical protein GGX14DRAFT_580796 [Mycena pura]